MSVCPFVCVHAFVCVCVVCGSLFVCVGDHMFVSVCVNVCVITCVRVCVGVCVCMSVCMGG